MQAALITKSATGSVLYHFADVGKIARKAMGNDSPEPANH